MGDVGDGGGADPGASGPWGAEAEGGGGVAGSRRGRIPHGGRQGDNDLRVTRLVGIQNPHLRLLAGTAELVPN